jgi:hypothetical protein
MTDTDTLDQAPAPTAEQLARAIGWRPAEDPEDEVAGGIARLGIGAAGGDTDSAGGILRFNLGERGH